MTSKPPRLAVSLVELFAPIDSAEGVLGDLEEEFVGQLARSGLRAARHWYWRQALRTTLHLLWGAVRVAPWLTTALVLASFIGASLLYGVLNRGVIRLVGQIPINDYNTAVWSWRAAALVRLVAVPLALGWSIAVVARGREMVITTLVAGLLVAILFWNLAVVAHYLVSRGLPARVVYDRFFQILQLGMTFPLGLVIGGMLRRRRQIHASRIAT